MFSKHIVSSLMVIISMFFFLIPANALDDGQPHGISSDNTATVITGDSTFTISGGKQSGNNLFHGFSSFNLHKGEQAIFEHGSNIVNIIGRISGDTYSWVNGTISAGASLYLLNPKGFIFGPDTVLDLGGSFHASTSDTIIFDDHAIFDMNTDFSAELPESDPAGFEFTSNNAFSSIILNDATLELLSGQDLSLVAGDTQPASLISNTENNTGLKMTNSHVSVSGGTIRMASVAAPATIRFDNWHAFKEKSDIAGKIVSNESVIQTGGQQTNESGQIFIVGGLFFGDQTTFNTAATQHAGDIDIHATQMELSNECFLDAQSYGNGEGGNVHLNIDNQLKMSESQIVASNNNGDAGRVDIKAKTMLLNNASLIATETSGAGHAGHISLDTQGDIILSNGSEILSKSKETATGDAGNIDLDAANISMTDVSLISADTDGSGNAGNVTIHATKLDLSKASRVSSSSHNSQQGGNAGEIEIKLTDDLNMNGSDTAIQTQSNGPGTAGSIDISAHNVFLTHHAQVSSSGMGILGNAGDAGSIHINADNLIQMTEKSQLATSSKNAGGGKIHIESDKMLYLSDITINTSVMQGWGSGGDINLSTQLLFTDSSTIQAQAENGPGGNISIQSKQFLQTSNNTINATSRLGIDGRVDITQPTSDIIMDVSQLPGQFLDDTARLSDVCAARFQKDISVFSLEGRGALPTAYNDWIPGSEITYDRPDIKFQHIPDRSKYLDPLCPFTEEEKNANSSE